MRLPRTAILATLVTLCASGAAMAADAQGPAADACGSMATALNMSKAQVDGQPAWKHGGGAPIKFLIGGSASYQIQFKGRYDAGTKSAGKGDCKPGKLDCVISGPGDLSFSLGGSVIIIPSKDSSGSVPLETGQTVHVWSKGMDLFCASVAAPPPVTTQ
jgi:hypothetical protein